MRNSTMQILRATLAVLALAGGGLLVTQALGQGTAAQGVGAEARISVITHHYDSLRSGWNQRETRLTASKFPASFGVIQSVALDDQVDAQPLIVPGETIAGGIHDVVYVVTENNSVYAIDANSGAILLHRNLGPPVPTPLGCGNNGPNVGITGTPVIDLSLGEIFVIAYINGSPPSYQLHALNLTTLADQLPPVTVAASQTLTDGSKFAFDATYQRQRPGLLEMNGTIYAGFGSFCDFDANLSRGWVLGWHSANLEPLAHAELNNSQASSPTDFFLSSVWMSGSGLAGEGDKVFFSTGNSDCNFYDNPEFCPSQSTYNGVTNIQESVINVNRTLSTRLGVFTPSNVYAMDVADADLGAAGVMIIAGDGGTSLATIVSKDGRLWLLDASNLSTILDMQQLGSGCWCAPTFFRGSDGISRVLSSAGNALQSWQIQGTSTPQLAPEATAYVQNGIQDPGFFTVVSSNGRKSGSAIIWAVARPTSSTPLTLYAFAAMPVNSTFTQLYSSPAGQWPYLGGNANIVPVVANGKVYVASYQALTIFGPNGSPAPASASVPIAAAAALPPGITRRVTGQLLSLSGTDLTLLTRTGQMLRIDDAAAVANRRVAMLTVGHAYTVLGNSAANSSVVMAAAVSRAKSSSATWPEDR
jgi:outer membrane protein assembly factor BamB